MIAFLRWFFCLIDRRPSPTRHLPPLDAKLLGVHIAQVRDKAWGAIPDRLGRIA